MIGAPNVVVSVISKFAADIRSQIDLEIKLDERGIVLRQDVVCRDMLFTGLPNFIAINVTVSEVKGLIGQQRLIGKLIAGKWAIGNHIYWLVD
jgi:hypothetical protein